MLVMIMCAISLIIMAGIMYRTSTVSKLNDRNNKYNQCCIAAGAATEKAFAQLAYYFQVYGLGMASNNLGIYQTNVPNSTDNTYWGQFAFSDGQGNVGQIYVGYLSNYAGAMPSQYTNLSTATAPIYRIVANAWMTNYPDIIGTAQEDVLLSLLPITTFAIFYNGPLEFTYCATMSVRGRTHANDIICVGTSFHAGLLGSGYCRLDHPESTTGRRQSECVEPGHYFPCRFLHQRTNHYSGHDHDQFAFHHRLAHQWRGPGFVPVEGAGCVTRPRFRSWSPTCLRRPFPTRIISFPSPTIPRPSPTIHRCRLPPLAEGSRHHQAPGRRHRLRYWYCSLYHGDPVFLLYE